MSGDLMVKGFSGQVFRLSAGKAWRALGKSKQGEDGRPGLWRPAQSLSWGHAHPMASDTIIFFDLFIIYVTVFLLKFLESFVCP